MPFSVRDFSRPGLRWLLALSFVASCKRHEPQVAYPTYPGGYPTQYPNQAPPGAQPQPGPPVAQPGQTAVAPLPPTPATPSGPISGPDPINQLDVAFLRNQGTGILRELVAALPPLQQGRVANIPLVVDSTIGEVNAFATCTREGRAAMAITDGLLEIKAQLARARAHDEIGGTRKVDEYIQLIARNQRPKQPIVRPAAGFFDPRIDNDARKVARQHQIFEEEVAFVLGHELAHHYLNHLPCTGAGALAPAEVARVLSDAVPGFNQPNELAADISGTNDMLTAGARRASGHRFTEGGAMLVMQFFSGLDSSSPADIFNFERSHPPPSVRVPVIQQTASAWRSTGGRGLPYPFF
ncbi:MAG TPA: M48 family metalloprotease [Polyangiaceae bacterium]